MKAFGLADCGVQTVVEWGGMGRLFWSPGHEVEFAPIPGIDDVRLQKFRCTALLACRRYLEGNVSLHGSAVALPGGAVALVGDCGAGKSTTAMALVEHHGGMFLADDLVPVDWRGLTPVVSPVDDAFWLPEDTSTWFGLPSTSPDKRHYPPRLRCPRPEQLTAVVHLSFDESLDGVAVESVSGRSRS